MNHYYNKFKINTFTYVFFFICFLCGYLKNVAIIFTIVLIHELGHIFFIKLFKLKICSIEILPFGGKTKVYKLINYNINKEILINLGGIIFQIIFTIILTLYKDNLNIITYNLFMTYNYYIIIFNILPIIPLDGNNIVKLLLEKFFAYQLSYYLNFFISTITLTIFLLINYYYNFDNYFIVSFLIYQLINYIKDFKYLFNKFLLERYLYNIDYKKIESKTKNIKELKKEVLHYFKTDGKVLNEQKVLDEYFKAKN